MCAGAVAPTRQHVAQIATRICFVAVMVDYIGVGMMRTLLPFYAKKLQGGAFLVGSLEAAYGVGQVIGAAFLPRMSDTRGRKVVLIISFLGSAVGYSLAGIASSSWLLLVSRIPVGLSKQTVAVSRAMFADCVPRESLSPSLARLTSLMGMGYTIGPFLGGYLSDLYGDSVPAFVAVSLFAVLIPLSVLYLPETNPFVASGSKVEDSSEERQADMLDHKPYTSSDETKRQARRRLLLLTSILMLPELSVIAYSGAGLSTLVPSLGKGRTFLGVLNSTTAAIAALHSAFMIPYLSATLRIKDRHLIMTGCFCFALGCFLLACFTNVTGIIVTCPVFAVSLSLLRSCQAAFLSKQAPLEMQGETMGILDSASSLCRVVAPLLTGFLVEVVGKSSPYWMAAILCSVGLVLLSVCNDHQEQVKRKDE